MTFRMVLVAMVAAAMVAAAHAHSASETTSSPGDPLHWNSITRSWECTSLNQCADQPDLAEAKDEKVLWEAKTNEASTKATMKAKVIAAQDAAQAENEKVLKAVQHAEAAVGRHKAKGMKNPAGAGIMLMQAQAGAAFGSGQWEFKGCYTDSSQRDLPINKGSGKEIQECADACKGFPYFGRQWDKGCWCGESYGSQGETTGCNCDENASNMGGWKNCVYEAYSPDDSLHFNPAQSDPASPLSNETSICRGWYISDGPVKHGSNQAAADALKSAADGTWRKGTTYRMGSPATIKAITTDGTGWGVGYKHGCTAVTNNGGNVITICGCYEIWCPIRMHILSHPDDIYGRDASGVDGSMAVRNKCYTARAVFGCYHSAEPNAGGWVDNCGWQKGEPDLYQPGSGNDDGQFMKFWEQLIL